MSYVCLSACQTSKQAKVKHRKAKNSLRPRKNIFTIAVFTLSVAPVLTGRISRDYFRLCRIMFLIRFCSSGENLSHPGAQISSPPLEKVARLISPSATTARFAPAVSIKVSAAPLSETPNATLSLFDRSLTAKAVPRALSVTSNCADWEPGAIKGQVRFVQLGSKGLAQISILVHDYKAVHLVTHEQPEASLTVLVVEIQSREKRRSQKSPLVRHRCYRVRQTFPPQRPWDLPLLP